MLFQEKLAKCGCSLPGGLEAASDILVLSSSSSVGERGRGEEDKGLPQSTFSESPPRTPKPHPGSRT